MREQKQMGDHQEKWMILVNMQGSCYSILAANPKLSFLVSVTKEVFKEECQER